MQKTFTERQDDLNKEVVNFLMEKIRKEGELTIDEQGGYTSNGEVLIIEKFNGEDRLAVRHTIGSYTDTCFYEQYYNSYVQLRVADSFLK